MSKFIKNEKVLFEVITKSGPVQSIGTIFHGYIESPAANGYYYVQGQRPLTGLYYIYHTKIHKLTNINKVLHL